MELLSLYDIKGDKFIALFIGKFWKIGIILNIDMFKNREEAGRLLAEKLFVYKGKEVIVLAVPRGGVVIGRIIADSLMCPLDVLLVKKLGAPGEPELAIGAMALGGEVYWDEDLCQRLLVSTKYKNRELKIKKIELARREKYLREKRKLLGLKGKIVVVTDDGVATGATAIAAARAIKNLQAEKVILAVPVIAKNTITEILGEIDELIYLLAPESFFAVGQFYEEFGQVSDEMVRSLINTEIRTKE